MLKSLPSQPSRTACAAIVLSLMLVAGCDFHEDKAANPDTSTTQTDPDAKAYAALEEALFKPQCLTCHNGPKGLGGVDLSSRSAVLNGKTASGSKLVERGKAAGSEVYAQIASGNMPPGGGVSAATLAQLEHWIDQNFSVTEPTPAPNPTPGEASFAEVQAKILTPHCVACHSGAQAAGSIDLSSQAAVLASGMVKAGVADTSRLYRVVANGRMPPPDGLNPQNPARQPLSDDLKQLLAQWIQAGATP